MIIKIEKVVTLYSAEKDGKVKELAFETEFLKVCKLKKKGYHIVTNRVKVSEYINIVPAKKHLVIRRKS